METPDRHGWNSLENYQIIHETRLNNHPFLDPDRPHTVEFSYFELDDGLIVQVAGEVFCLHNVTLEVEKYLETEDRAGRIYVRGLSYRYNARVRGRHNVLRYDNGHDLNEYHRHVWDIRTGEEREFSIISRNEFPTLGEILDQLEGMFRGF